MERLTDFNLPAWAKEELIDMLEDYPRLFEMSEVELQRLARDLYQKAQGYIDTANRLENEADVIIKYCLEKYINPRIKK